MEWDAWYVLEADARQSVAPRHAWREDRRDTSWAMNRAHWLAGRYANLHGREPAEVVPPPTWTELEVDLDREVEHLEAHVAEGDTDPFEATYAFLNGSRILRALGTGDVAHLQANGRPCGRSSISPTAGTRSSVLQAVPTMASETAEDANLLAREMAPFVAMVRQRLPTERTDGEPPRWSGS